MRHVIVTRKEHDFSSLDTAHLLNLNISFNHPAFADVYQVTVTKVSLGYPGYVPGAKNYRRCCSEKFHWRCTLLLTPCSCGRVWVYNYGEKEVTAEGNLAGQGYVGLSPFTTWNLNFTYLEMISLSSVR